MSKLRNSVSKEMIFIVDFPHLMREERYPHSLILAIAAHLSMLRHHRFFVFLDLPLHYVTDTEKCQINSTVAAMHKYQVVDYICFFFSFCGHLGGWLPLQVYTNNIDPTIYTSDRCILHSVYLAVASLQCAPVQ